VSPVDVDLGGIAERPRESERDAAYDHACRRAEQARKTIERLHRELGDEQAILQACESSIAHLERGCEQAEMPATRPFDVDPACYQGGQVGRALYR
jgi:hypothetical protein